MSEYATTVAQLFPDYAESVIWLREPVSYEQTRLDAQLIEELKTWDRSYYAGLSPANEWRTSALEAKFVAEGARLARRLAAQIGDAFHVQHDVLGGSPRRVRGRGPARNPDAAAAFRRLAEAASADGKDLLLDVDQTADDRHTPEWRA